MPRGGFRIGAGRPKGSHNPLTLAREHIIRLCEEADYNPIRELIDIARSDDPKIPLKLKAEVHKELLSYLAPKLKSITVENVEDRQVIVQLVDFSNQIADGHTRDS